MRTENEILELFRISCLTLSSKTNRKKDRRLFYSKEYLHPTFMYYHNSDCFDFYSQGWYDLAKKLLTENNIPFRSYDEHKRIQLDYVLISETD